MYTKQHLTQRSDDGKGDPVHDSVTFIHSDLFNPITSIKICLHFSDETTKTQSHCIQNHLTNPKFKL